MVDNCFVQFIVRILLLQIISRLDLKTNGDRRIKWKFIVTWFVVVKRNMCNKYFENWYEICLLLVCLHYRGGGVGVTSISSNVLLV